MIEKEQKYCHFQNITLRFKPISDFVFWKCKSNYIPNLKSIM